MPCTDLSADYAPLTQWLTQPDHTILIVIGNGPGAQTALGQINLMLTEAPDQYPDVSFAVVSDASQISSCLDAAAITGISDYALIAIGPNLPKVLKAKVIDSDLVGNPGWVQNALWDAATP